MHIGKLIHSVCKQKSISAISLSKRLNVERNTVYSIYKKESIQVSLLKEICRALDHDFFKMLSDELTDNQH